VLARHYAIDWRTIPDLGWDLWAVAVGRVLPLEWTGKLFLALSQAITLGGALMLGRILAGRWTAVPLLAAPFLFSAAYTRGFLAFDLGFGLSLWAMAWWLWMPAGRWVLRLAVATLLSTLLYVVHLYAWAVYGVFVLGMELDRLARAPRQARPWALGETARDALQALPPLVLAWLAAGTAVRSDAPAMASFDPPYARLVELEQFVDIGHPALNVVAVILLLALVFVPVLVGRMRFVPRARVPVALFVALFFLLPDDVYDTSHVAWRVLLPAIVLGIASIRPPSDVSGRRLLSVQLAVAVAVTLAIPLWQIGAWRTAAAEKADFLALIQDIPDGSRLFFAHSGVTKLDLATRFNGAYHVAAWAVPAKRALVQTMFAFPGQQPLRFVDPALTSGPKNSLAVLGDIVRAYREAGTSLAERLTRHFDYVVMHGRYERPETLLLPMQDLRRVGEVGDFRLYAVAAPEGTASGKRP
jgi:hypothetical protein